MSDTLESLREEWVARIGCWDRSEVQEFAARALAALERAERGCETITREHRTLQQMVEARDERIERLEAAIAKVRDAWSSHMSAELLSGDFAAILRDECDALKIPGRRG